MFKAPRLTNASHLLLGGLAFFYALGPAQIAQAARDGGSPSITGSTPVHPSERDGLTPDREKELKEMEQRLLIPEIEGGTKSRQDFLKELENSLKAEASKIKTPWTPPNSLIDTPGGYGAQWTDVFAGVGIENRSRFGSNANGTGAVGMGFGNAARYIGVEVSALTFGFIRNTFPFAGGGVDIKVHHLFPYQIGVALGVENIIAWGGFDTGYSAYLVGSKIFTLKKREEEMFSSVTVHLGLGNGRFRSIADIQADNFTVGIFGSVGLRIIRQVSLIASWNGQDLSTGLSYAPFHTFPIVLSAATVDTLGRNGDSMRFVFALSYSDSVLSPSFPVDWFKP